MAICTHRVYTNFANAKSPLGISVQHLQSEQICAERESCFFASHPALAGGLEGLVRHAGPTVAPAELHGDGLIVGW